MPADCTPRVCDGVADHRGEHTLLVGRVAPSEAALHARMAFVGATVLVGHHPDYLVSPHLGLERAADAAVRTGRDHASARHAQGDDRLLFERRGRARLYACAAGDALGAEEAAGTRRDLRGEATACNCQRESALGLLAGAHATRANDALGAIEAEVRVALVLLGVEMVVTGVAVANLPEPDSSRHVLELAVPVRRAGEAVEGMVRDVKLHHAAAELGEARCLGRHLHAGPDRSRARRRCAGPAVDLDQT